MEFLGVNMDVIRVLLSFLEKRLHQVGTGACCGGCPVALAFPSSCGHSFCEVHTSEWRWAQCGGSGLRPNGSNPAGSQALCPEKHTLGGSLCCCLRGIESSVYWSTCSLHMLGAPSRVVLRSPPAPACDLRLLVSLQASLGDWRQLSQDPQVLVSVHIGWLGLSAALRELEGVHAAQHRPSEPTCAR